MTKICIYCDQKDQDKFKGVEHVIPQSFGKFGTKTPTLDCVCDDCNAYFAKELDQILARDTIEGVTRYKKGKLSSQQRFPKSLRFQLNETENEGEYGGALVGGIDPLTGKSLPLVPQFWIYNIQDKKWERYLLEEIKSLVITDEKYGDKTPNSRRMKVLGSSKEEYDAVIAELKKYDIPYKEKEMLGPPPFLKNTDPCGKILVEGTIKGKIDKVRKRSFVKIIFNFAAYYIGRDEVLKPEWNEARNFVRLDGPTLLARMSEKEFWTGQETRTMRFADNSFNVRLENQGKNLIGVIQFYNLFTYEFILVQNYNVPPEKEAVYRFTPNEEPVAGVKMNKPAI